MKCLVISHNPFSTFQNMGKTFLSLFAHFAPHELCQFYIYPSIPDTAHCGAYYRVTDKEILKSYYTPHAPGGEIKPTNAERAMFENPADEALYRSPKNKTAFRMLARDAMWRFSRWNNRTLQDFLDREQPSCLLVAPGQSKFIYNVALRIAKERALPIIAYICDDYYFVEEPQAPAERYRVHRLQKKIEELMAHTAHIVTICEEMSAAYAEKFGIPTTTVMTGTSYPPACEVRVCENPRIITYTGNIRCNRYLSLAKIGKALDSINLARGTDYELRVYTGEKDEQILSHFNGIRSLKLCGFVTGEAFRTVLREADFLLHTEAFDKPSIDRVKHSVSTKIADALAGGIPLLAFGPAQVSSMKHLLRNDCALCATTEEELQDMLLCAFENSTRVREVATKALAVAAQYHDPTKTGEAFYHICEELK